MTVVQISVQELAALGTAARIVDVREPGEWDQGHIAHSGQACEFLAQQGIDVINVAGGMLAWTAAGYDTAVGTGATGG